MRMAQIYALIYAPAHKGVYRQDPAKVRIVME